MDGLWRGNNRRRRLRFEFWSRPFFAVSKLHANISSCSLRLRLKPTFHSTQISQQFNFYHQM